MNSYLVAVVVERCSIVLGHLHCNYMYYTCTCTCCTRLSLYESTHSSHTHTHTHTEHPVPSHHTPSHSEHVQFVHPERNPSPQGQLSLYSDGHGEISDLEGGCQADTKQELPTQPVYAELRHVPRQHTTTGHAEGEC